jgi:hypothetical protein
MTAADRDSPLGTPTAATQLKAEGHGAPGDKPTDADKSRHLADGVGTLCNVTATNDEFYLQNNLLASAMIQGGIPLQIERGAISAAAAYNHGLDSTDAPIVIFAHQDVYFPPGWERLLLQTLAKLERQDPDWALVAPYGISRQGEHVGEVWSTSIGRRLGGPFDTPVPAQSFDELVIVMRRSSGLRFDEGLPGFHLYGTDIVQTALARGKGAYIAWLPVVHNDKFHGALGEDFAASYHYARRKWRHCLPLRTPVEWIRWHGMSLKWSRWLDQRSIETRRALAGDSRTDPRLFSRACGWETEDWPDRRPSGPPPPDPTLHERLRAWVGNMI